MRYPLTCTLVLVLYSVFVGCNGSSATVEPKGSTEGTDSTLAKDGNANSNVAASSSKSNLNAPSADSVHSPTELKKPTLTKSTTDQAAEPNTTVDHQDPTSYTITALGAKVAGDIMMLSWNVESDGSEADTICSELKALNTGDRYDVVALTEVLPENFKKFRVALGKHYKYAYSKSGRNDRMQILYNENRFKKVRHFEIQEINYLNRYRAPLVLHLSERKTDERPDQIQFMVMANHLARGNAEIRQKQSADLVEWARKESLPIIALGDYNFDYVFETDKGNPAFAKFMRDNIWKWVAPTEMVDTNWYDNPESPDGKDDYPGSMLDFGFVSGPAKEWLTKCNVIVRKNDFPDNERTSDHRPFELIVKTSKN